MYLVVHHDDYDDDDDDDVSLMLIRATYCYCCCDDDTGLMCKMCDIYSQALQKRIWHIQTAVINSVEYDPHV